jgi:hypothetical protein
MPFCFVMQPFDGGDFDKRFEEIYKPAIEEAGFQPYRVDRDPSATILIDNIENGIRDSVACFADITTDNPNVWFELGYAICAKKPMCIICGHEREKFPFDIQHRKIIRYKRASPSDFVTLRTSIVERLKYVMEHDATIEKIVETVTFNDKFSADIVKSDALSDMDFSALCIVFEEHENDPVSGWSIGNRMERAGYTKIATKISLKNLTQSGLIKTEIEHDPDGQGYVAYAITDAGEKHVLSNIDKVKLRRNREDITLGTLQKSLLDDDIPF